MLIEYLTEETFKKIQSLKNIIELNENIFDLSNYTKKNKNELKEAISELSKKAEEKYNNLFNTLSKKYKTFYDETGINPITVIYDCSKQTSELKFFAKMISKRPDKEISISYIKKLIREDAPFEITLPLYITNDKNIIKDNSEDKSKDNKIKGKVVFIIVPKNTILTRLLVNVYRFATNSFLNHPLWSQIEELIFLNHELIEAEEYIIENRNNHPSGQLIVKADKNHQISHHNSVIVLAKEAIILNKYKNIKALQKMREFRRLEWKTVKNLTGVDLSILTHLDDKTTKKLLNMKLTEVHKSKRKGKEVVIKRPVVNYEDAINTKIANYISVIPNLFKKFKKFKISDKKINFSLKNIKKY